MNYFPLTLGFEGVDSNWFKVIFSCQTLCTNNPDLLQISLKLEWNISIKIKNGGKACCYLHQDVDSTINATWNQLWIARNFAKSQKISNRKTPLVCNCPLYIAPTISKVHKWNVHFAEADIRGLHVGVGVADNRPPLAKPPLTGFLRDLALIARIRGGDLGLHMAAAPIEHKHQWQGGEGGQGPSFCS